MPYEVELKLALSPKDLRRLQALPWIRAMGRSAARQMLVSVYYDTEQFTLRDDGVSLRVRRIGNKRLQTVKAAGSGAPFARREWEEEIASDKPDFACAKGTALEPLLNKALRRDLKPVFETSVQRTAFLIRQGKSEVELAIDRGTIKSGGHSRRISEIELELKNGDAAALCKITQRLSKTLPIRYGAKTKSERGYALVEARESEAARGEAIVLEKNADTATAFQTIGFSCLRHVACNEDAVRKRDAEGIHQMRVDLRRLRAAVSIFKDILKDPQSERLNSDLKWLTDQLGPARDYDVFLEESILPQQNSQPKRKEFGTLQSVLRKKRTAGFGTAKDVVAGDRYRRLVLRVALWLADGKWCTSSDPLRRGGRARPIAAFAREVLTKRTKKIVREIRNLEHLDARRRHKLRIAIKKLRYTSEFFVSLFADAKKERKAFGKVLEKLQRALGTLNDIQVHKRLIDTIVHTRGIGQAKSREASLAAGLVAAQEQSNVEPLLAAATKAGKHLAKLRPFWK